MNAPDEWRNGVEKIHAQSGGLVKIFILPPAEGACVMMAAAMGDPFCGSLAMALAKSAKMIVAASRREPAICLCCPRPLVDVRGVTLVLAVPGNDSPDTALGSALCRACAQLPDAEDLVLNAMRGIWPNLRPITVSHAAGHA